MMHELRQAPLNTNWIPPELKGCPFCGANPYWIAVRLSDWDPRARTQFFHPGVTSRDGCILSGIGFAMDQVDLWNTRKFGPQV